MIPDDPDWLERYENPGGYDSTWQGAVTGGTSVYDPNQATSGVTNVPDNWGSECLKVAPQVAETSMNNAYPYGSGNEQPVFYFKMDFMPSDISGMIDDTYISIFRLVSKLAGPAFEGRLSLSGGNLYIQVDSYHDGGSNVYTSVTTLSTDMNYRIEVKWDATDNKWAWRINNINQPNNIDGSDPITTEGTLTSTHPTDIREIFVGSLPAAITATYYVDNIGVDIDGWIGDIGTGVRFQKDDMILEWFEEPDYPIDHADKRAVVIFPKKEIVQFISPKTVEPSTNTVVKTVTTTVKKKTTTPTTTTDKTLDIKV